jgi:hypothetical protein
MSGQSYTQFPAYDVLDKRHSPSWNDQTRAVVDKQLHQVLLVGRAPLCGVAAGGKDGAKRALDILREEILRDFGLLEVRPVAELGPRLLVRHNGTKL